MDRGDVGRPFLGDVIAKGSDESLALVARRLQRQCDDERLCDPAGLSGGGLAFGTEPADGCRRKIVRVQPLSQDRDGGGRTRDVADPSGGLAGEVPLGFGDHAVLEGIKCHARWARQGNDRRSFP